ncbi:DNA adenine methylase [Nitrosococcus wardiae]|uniref:site-specific DNA-methyltransferase (adenine-specific) n=1 Tax=Nitrosococcus wardiae TaxID=1814290 RepID=A0A4P7C3J8_9GAMM|nr:DNA adenine methylase [Nitrosococcus wardiae]QBQ53081.1 DNA adenine methylase [Nitrosococcus wardiae]QBQ56361.1 DNA adenine methylase [Nitrosococcus wardiae]QBQ56379.1 DNA adenine methylase [Nitrosococcus wardiae]
MSLGQPDLFEVFGLGDSRSRPSYGNYILKERFSPLLKWPGGKTAELSLILPRMPQRIGRFFEPFVGGGAVFFSLSSKVPAYLNDFCTDLIAFYRQVATSNEDFYSMLEAINRYWKNIEEVTVCYSGDLIRIYLQYKHNYLNNHDLKNRLVEFIIQNSEEFNSIFSNAFNYDIQHLIGEIESNLFNKMQRMKKLEAKQGELSQKDLQSNLEGAIKSAFYMHMRYLYNYPCKHNISEAKFAAIFFFIREYAYAAMFRFNKSGQFNVPYGGISYNRKDIKLKVNRLRQRSLLEKLEKAVFENMDFEEFLEKFRPKKGDFIFLDPPYDTDFSDYDKNIFDKSDQKRLANYLINHCQANFMLVIKATDFIISLYEKKDLNIQAFDKKYMWTIKERNIRETKHLMITNYKL